MDPTLAATAPRSEEPLRFSQPPALPIEHATDLGSVLALKQNALYLLTDPFGDIHPDSRGLGLYRHDTRVLSCAVLRLDGHRPALLRAAEGATWESSIEMTNPEPRREAAEHMDTTVLARNVLGIRRRRTLGAALDERLDIVNHGEIPAALRLELTLGADFADIFEVRGYQRPARGRLLPTAFAADRRVQFAYIGLDGRLRRTWVEFDDQVELEPVDPEADPSVRGGSIAARWRWTLPPGDLRQIRWTAWSEPAQPPRRRADHPHRVRGFWRSMPRVDRRRLAEADHHWAATMARIRTDDEIVNRVLDRSVSDLRLLMTPGPGPRQTFVAAGVPWFSALFGRDAMITSLEMMAIRPSLAVQTLDVLAEWQATEVDDWRDAEPGKILHELRTGEVAAAGELPFSPYYGSVDSTPLWLVLLGEAWAWTGDRALVERLWPHALRALEWIDRWGDADGDGFVEYQRRSPRGLGNQGWKDSEDSVRFRDGTRATGPIALAEVQGYVYRARRAMAELAAARGELDLAQRLERQALDLRRRFDEAFWDDELGCFAMALDGDKRRVDAIASNAGQCLWTGIVEPERAPALISRLLDPSMSSGWGLRTYASDQPGYNPMGYHTGSVWPHDTCLVAAGMKRYGFHDAADRLIAPLVEAASHFPAFRLPELFCGFSRDIAAGPVPYPVACAPHAWSAAAPFLVLQTMLGLEARAHRGELDLVAPHLPSMVRSVRFTGLRVGDAVVDLLFHAWRGTTSAEVLRKEGDLRITVHL